MGAVPANYRLLRVTAEGQNIDICLEVCYWRSKQGQAFRTQTQVMDVMLTPSPQYGI